MPAPMIARPAPTPAPKYAIAKFHMCAAPLVRRRRLFRQV
jgi:hypothetical protein